LKELSKTSQDGRHGILCPPDHGQRNSRVVSWRRVCPAAISEKSRYSAIQFSDLRRLAVYDMFVSG
jgi:hypothetical protein